MKKLLSIALLLVFLFNLGGYYLVYWCLSYQAKIEMDCRLDATDYSKEEIVTIKIPLSIPYYFDQKDYERIEGSYEQNGEFFKLIKQKFERDTLYIVSMKDYTEKRLFNALADFVKLSNDLPVSSPLAMKLLNNMAKDFTPNAQTEILEPQCVSRDYTHIQQLFNLVTNDIPVFSPPPES